MGWQRDARKAITLQDWRSTTFCRSRMSCTRPPRLRNGWTTWHSARRLRRVRWSTKRSRRRCSWYRIYKGASWRSLPNLWSLQPHRKSPNRLFLPLQDTKYTSRKPVKPGIWDWMCRVQESLHVVPWPRDGSRLEDEPKDVRGSAGGPLSKLPRGSGGRGLGRRKLMVLRRCAAVMGQASEDKSGWSCTMRRSRQVSDHDNCTLAS